MKKSDKQSAHIDVQWCEGGVCSFKVEDETFELLFVESNNKNMDSFFMGETPVTKEQWESVMGYSNCEFGDDIDFNFDSDLPVVHIEWIEAIKFVVKLSFITGRTFWLPTMQEWIYAAKGGNKSKGYKYSGSNNLDEVAWYDANSDDTTHSVGTKLPNELGLYDMNGNVSELCYDLVCGCNRICCGGSYISTFDNYTSLDNCYDDDFEQVRYISPYTGVRIVLLSDEHLKVDYKTICHHLSGDTDRGTEIVSKQTFDEDCDLSIDDLFYAYDQMFYNIYEFADSFDYDLVLLLLKLTEGNGKLRSQLRKKLNDWLKTDDF